MDRPGVCQVTWGRGEQRKMEEIGCEITGGAQTTLTVKGLVKLKAGFSKISDGLRAEPDPGY